MSDGAAKQTHLLRPKPEGQHIDILTEPDKLFHLFSHILLQEYHVFIQEFAAFELAHTEMFSDSIVPFQCGKTTGAGFEPQTPG